MPLPTANVPAWLLLTTLPRARPAASFAPVELPPIRWSWLLPTSSAAFRDSSNCFSFAARRGCKQQGSSQANLLTRSSALGCAMVYTSSNTVCAAVTAICTTLPHSYCYSHLSCCYISHSGRLSGNEGSKQPPLIWQWPPKCPWQFKQMKNTSSIPNS